MTAKIIAPSTNKNSYGFLTKRKLIGTINIKMKADKPNQLKFPSPILDGNVMPLPP